MCVCLCGGGRMGGGLGGGGGVANLSTVQNEFWLVFVKANESDGHFSLLIYYPRALNTKK